MPKVKQLFENTLVGLAALAIVLVCSSSLLGQASGRVFSDHFPAARPKLPPGVPEGYVSTPFGYFHPSCVRHLAKGDTLLADGRVSHVDGKVDAIARICDHPHFPPAGLLVPEQTARAEAEAPPDPQIEYISALSRFEPYSKLSASWTVPPLPTAEDGQTLYLFPGFQDFYKRNGSGSILQPVLQYGQSAAGGDNYWAIASWNCCLDGFMNYSDLVKVYPGDSILGSITSTCNPEVYSCPKWNVLTTDETTQQSTELKETPSEGQVWNWALGAVLEVNNVIQCGDYPANSDVTFSVNLHDQAGRLILRPRWQEHKASQDTEPYCGFGLASTATEETVEYGIYAPTYFLTGNWAGTATDDQNNVYSIGAAISQTASAFTATVMVQGGDGADVYTVTGQINGNTVTFTTTIDGTQDAVAMGTISANGLQVSGSGSGDDMGTGTMTWDGRNTLSGMATVLDDTATGTVSTDGQHLTGKCTLDGFDYLSWNLTRQ